MKNYMLYILIVFFNIGMLFAQVPQSFNYQAVVRDATGQIVNTQAVTLRFTITDAATGGNILYRERHNTTTNQFGLVTAEIGNGTLLNGTFAGINWGSGNRYLQVEVDPNGGNTFVDMGTSQLLSVPYALFAGNNGGSGGATGPTGAQGVKGATGATGPTGATGAQGVKGATGPTGATGSFTPTASINGATLRNNGTNWEPSITLFNTGSRIGINTTGPIAKFTVADSSVVFGTLNILPPDGIAGTVSPSYTPLQGSPLTGGMGLIWYADKAAFRAGGSLGSGWQTSNMGYYSTAMGFNAKATGTWSMASGFDVLASGNASAAIGYGLSAPSFAEVAVGLFNRDYIPLNSTANNSADRAFVVGTGTGSSTLQRRDALTVFKNGRTKIGDNGTAITNLQEGTINAGTQTGNNKKVVTITFPNSFNSANAKVLLTPKLGNGISDAFILSVRNITTTQCTVEIFRADAAAGTGWGSAFDIQWMAWE